MSGPRAGTRALAWAIPAAVAIAFLARAPFLQDSLWYDEIAAFLGYSLDGPWGAMSRYFSQANHVLASVLESLSAAAFGVDELSIRLPSLLAGIGTVLAVAMLARQAGGDRLAAAAAMVTAVMPIAVLPSTEGRGYALVTLFAALSSAFVLRGMDGKRGSWAAYAAASALGAWSHMVFACLPAGHAAWLGWRCAAAVRAGDATARARALAGLGAVAAAGALALLLHAPILGQIVALRSEFRALDGNEPTLLGPEGVRMLWSIGGTWAWWSSLAAVPLVAAGIAAAARDARLRAALAVSLAGVPVALLFPTVLGSWMYARFLAFAVPGIALLAAAGAVHLLAARPRVGWAAVLLACSAWATSLAGLGERQPLRAAVQFAARQLQAGERAFAVGLPDDVHRWYSSAAGIDMPGSGPYGVGMPMHLNDRSMRVCILLYPRALADRRTALKEAGFTEVRRFDGWIDDGDGDVIVLRR